MDCMTSRREARLKSAFADLYPGLRPDVWYSAAWLSARQLARTPCDGGATSIAGVLNEEHFQFRGGRPRGLRPSLGESPEQEATEPTSRSSQGTIT
jgi:hypothetical protein